MSLMNTQSMLTELSALGMTQYQIAEACGISQPYVSDLIVGRRKTPGLDIGLRIINLHKRMMRKQRRKNASLKE